MTTAMDQNLKIGFSCSHMYQSSRKSCLAHEDSSFLVVCCVCFEGRDPCLFLLVLPKTVMKPGDLVLVAFHFIHHR